MFCVEDQWSKDDGKRPLFQGIVGTGHQRPYTRSRSMTPEKKHNQHLGRGPIIQGRWEETVTRGDRWHWSPANRPAQLSLCSPMLSLSSGQCCTLGKNKTYTNQHTFPCCSLMPYISIEAYALLWQVLWKWVKKYFVFFFQQRKSKFLGISGTGHVQSMSPWEIDVSLFCSCCSFDHKIGEVRDE